MPGPILTQSPAQPQYLATAAPIPKAADPVAVAMDPTTAALLAHAITTGAVHLDAGSGKTYQGDAPMRDPRVPFAEAGRQFLASVAGLQALMTLLAANVGQTQTQEGTAVRSTEAAATGVQTRSAVDNPVAPASNPPATGVDTKTGRGESAGVSFKMSVIVNLLVELRKLLLEAREQDRKEAADLIIMQDRTVELAGQAGVDATVDQLSGAIAAGVLMTAVAAASMQRNMKATNERMGSMERNQLKANDLAEFSKKRSAAIKSDVTPEAHLRPAHNLDGTPVPGGNGGRQSAADVQPDASVDLRAMDSITGMDPNQAKIIARRAIHEQSMESANRAMYQGTLLGAVSGPISNLGSASFEIAASGDRKVQMERQQAADTQKAMADGRESQARNTEEMNEATRQLVQTLLQMMADTSNHVISKMS